MRHARARHAVWLRHNGAMMHGWQHGRRCRRSAHELLQQADVEHIVKACAFRQLQTLGDLVDDGGDAVRPVEARLQLAGRRDVEGGRSALPKA